MKKQVSLKIFGQVQGTGYRYSAQKQAKKLGLTGYVKNLPDGSVELAAEGEEQDLKDLLAWCYTGVGSANVDHIDAAWAGSVEEFTDFMIKF